MEMEWMIEVQWMIEVKRMLGVESMMEDDMMMKVEWMMEVERIMDVERMVVMGQGVFQHLQTALACSQSMLHIHLLCASCSLFLQVDSAQAC